MGYNQYKRNTLYKYTTEMSATLIDGLDGAAKIFNILSVDFSDNALVTQKTQLGNPYTFIVKEDKELFLTVYDSSDDFGHFTRITFGPSEILRKVKQNLEITYGITDDFIKSRINNESNNFDVVTLEFDHDQSLAGEHFMDGEVDTSRKVADTVIEALCDMY